MIAEMEIWHADSIGRATSLILQYAGLARTQGPDKLYDHHRVNEKLVWRYQSGKYVRVSGADPFEHLNL